MATFKSFTEIDAWQKSRVLTNAIYSISKNSSFSKDFGLRDQLRRASVSTMANRAEGFGRSGSAEFQQYLAIAKGSTCEVISHLYVALDQGYVNREEFTQISRLAEETANLIGGLMKYIQRSSIKGVKYAR
ncbi:MAG TPA: four helix bundle protein [Candidatus Limnocylindrales bacterium]|nr:four helix bundle protein [Candidatus Limnocylindrales bacterium]